MSYADFFKRATRTEKEPDGLKPFPYQCRLAEEPWPDLLDVPTGLPSDWKRTLSLRP